MTKRILSTCAVALLFCSFVVQANAAFYLRPVVQLSSLADGHSDADLGYGGGLAWGAVFGQQHQFEVGMEITRTRFEGNFEVPVIWYPPVGYPISGYVWQKVPATCDVTPILATFRYTFMKKNEKIRPYLGMAFGYSWVEVDESVREPIGMSTSTGVAWTGGLGGGVSYQLGRLTSVDLGYRYVFSDAMASGGFSDFNYKIRYTAHVVTLAVTQRFGRARK